MKPQTARDLERTLLEECATYEQYLSLLSEERAFVIAFKSDKVQAISEKRAKVAERLEALKARRLELMQVIEPGSTRRLSELVQDHGAPSEKKVLMPHIKKLKSLVTAAQKLAQELGQVVSFSLGFINGSLTLMNAAARGVSRSYGSNGRVRENPVPTRTRADMVIKEA